MTDPIKLFKQVYSTIALILSIIVIMGLIAKSQTKISNDVHPALAYVVGWGTILWLTMVEGGQASLVGLLPVNKELYKESHPLSYKCTAITNEGDNLDRYLLGRQFMVVLVVFSVNMSCAPIEGAEIWGFSKTLKDIILGSGLVMILFTCMVGQLNSQVNASHCMLDYINNYFAVFTLYVAMAIEFSGLLHSSYLIQILVGKMAGQPIESNEGPREGGAAAFFWLRCLASLAILCFCLAVTLVALFEGKTTMWEGVPPGLALVVFLILLSVVGMLEGMQIAFFAVAKLRESERGDSVFAKKTCHLLFSGKGNNLPGFMVGRQLCVVSCMFFVARVTSVSLDDDEDLMGFSDSMNEFLGTGLLGALIVTIVGSISWQLVASAFPIAFLNSPITYVLLRWCLFLEATGICMGAWVLAAIHRKIAGFQRDEVYIGTAEERAAQNMGDAEVTALGAGHMIKLPGFYENAPSSLQKLMKKDPSISQYITEQYDNAESGKAEEK